MNILIVKYCLFVLCLFLGFSLRLFWEYCLEEWGEGVMGEVWVIVGGGCFVFRF